MLQLRRAEGVVQVAAKGGAAEASRLVPPVLISLLQGDTTGHQLRVPKRHWRKDFDVSGFPVGSLALPPTSALFVHRHLRRSLIAWSPARQWFMQRISPLQMHQLSTENTTYSVLHIKLTPYIVFTGHQDRK